MTKRPPIGDINVTRGLIGLGPIPGLAPVAAFNSTLTESLLQTKGIGAMHFLHAPNPDRESLGAPADPNTMAAQWGFIYFERKFLKVVPQNMSLENRLQVQGIWGLHTVLLNVSSTYTPIDGKAEKENVFFRPNDLIIMDKDIAGNMVTILTDQQCQYNPTGPLKLNFRAEAVKLIRDRHKTYISDQDYALKDGRIHWLQTGRRPDQDSILSVVYWIRPVYIVKNVPHALRILPSNSIGHGGLPRTAEYAPQLVIAQQAWIRQDATQLLDFSELPGYPEYPTSGNVTGGSY